MGYTKIVGTPVVTGLYTILLPIAVFALIGSSRHLVVGADSATAAILFSGLSVFAQPMTAHWLALTSAAAIVTSLFLFAAALLRLGFVGDFLSRTVLVGFLSGVGISLMIRELPDLVGRSAAASMHWPTLALALGVIAVIVVLERVGKNVPAALVAIAAAILAAWLFRWDRQGIALVGSLQSGLPALDVPSVSWNEAWHLIPMSGSMFVVIVAQSAATSRSFAQRHGESFDEDRDLFGLAAANAVAGLSSTFVVNGSPTKTAVVDSAGARTQLAQLATAAITLLVILIATPVIEWLPVSALAALVFLIGIHLVDVSSLRQIFRYRRVTFVVAIATLVAVVVLGVARGIAVAIVLSVLDHLRQEYRPKDVVLTRADGHLKATRARPGLETAPGLIVYRFEAPLFFANADHFSRRVQEMVRAAASPVRWFVFDCVSMGDIDYTGGLALAGQVELLRSRGIVVGFADVEDVERLLARLGLLELVGGDHVFDTIVGAIDAFHALTERPARLARDPSA